MTARLFRLSLLALCLTTPQMVAGKETPSKDTPATVPETQTAKPVSPGQSAARERQRKCGTEWRGLTDAQKTAKGPKWPQFWSQCNKRLKGNDKV